MSTPWRATINPIKDGEPVQANVSNRPIQQLRDQAAHLKEVVDGLSNTSGRLVFTNAPLGMETAVLDVVYYDVGEMCFRPAIAEVVQEPVFGKMVCGPRAMAVGIIISKESPTSGTILQCGRINLNDEGLDPSSMIANPFGETFAPGRFFLSNVVPGKITASPVMPSIQVGFLSERESSISILHKDLFESHQHHRYSLASKPSASQNYAQTGWTSFELSTSADVKRVDYYNAGASAVPPQIIMCIRHPGGVSRTEANPARIELFNDSGSLSIDLIEGGIDYADPLSAGSTTTSSSRSWPAYGEWVSAGFETGLEVAFIRADADYSNTLAVDAASLLTTTAKKFKVFLPQDLSGWTNANPFDLTFAPNSLYRYLIGGDPVLLGVYPPLPISSAIVEMNGSSMVPTQDFEATVSALFWKLGFITPNDYAPWPSDYSIVDTMSEENARNLTLYFIKSGMDALNSVVFSLRGVAPIKVTRCPEGTDATAGHLQVSIDLALLVSSAAPEVVETSLSSVSGVEFHKGLSVAELIEGPGIRLENITPSSAYPTKKVGLVRVSSRLAKYEGEFNSIALRNAKEMISAFGSYIDFIPTVEGNSGITIQFKIPNLDINMDLFSLAIFAKVRGSLAVSGASASQIAIFKAVYHVLRPGFIMSAMNEANAVATQYWNIVFPTGYVASTILAQEYPYAEGNAGLFDIGAPTLIANPSSLVALSGGFIAGDQFAITIDRVSDDGSGGSSSYPGRVGFTGMRWLLK